MLESLLPYYERELGQLRELSGEFAARYPRIAGRLQLQGDQSEDPHTERLIESFAFLAARIHKKLDDEYPEVATSFMDVLYPHYQQPAPSATVVQFTLDEQRPDIVKRYRVARGHSVHAPALDGISCKFRSVYDVDLYPLQVQQVKLELCSGSPHLQRLAPDAAAVLTLTLHTQSGLALDSIDLDNLRFFLDGEAAQMHLLYELLLGQTLHLDASNGDDNTRIRLPAASIQPVGFAADETMLDYDERSFSGYRLLTEYFCYPDKFLFVDIVGLAPLAARLSGQQLQLRCFLKHYPDSERHQRLLTQLQTQHFKLGCTPLINLFAQAAEPVRVTHKQQQITVQADARKPLAHEVIQLKRVVRVEKSEQGEHSAEVPPFYAIRHGSDQGAPRFYWHSSRVASPRQDDKGSDLQLHLVDLAFSALRPEAEVLSMDLLCSNRDLPEQLPFGGNQSSRHTDFSLPGHSVVQRVRLLRKPGASQRAPLRRGLQWRLVSHLSLNYLSIIESGGQALQEILTLYNRSESAANVRQIQGIQQIRSAPALTRVHGRGCSSFVRGTDIWLTLNEDHYAGGSVYLFASVMERFFAMYCAPNSFTRLHVNTIQQNGEVASWPARAGEALVI